MDAQSTTTNTEHSQVTGIQPALPWPMARSSWWTNPIRGEVYALLRIGLAAVLLLDQMFTILPYFNELFGSGTSGDPNLAAWIFESPQAHWSVLEGIGDVHALRIAFWVWVLATASLLVGWNTRLCAILVWVLGVSFNNINLGAINAGDHIRGILLFYLMFTPCGIVWSVDSWLKRGQQRGPEQTLVPAWPLRLILVQMAFMYCASGLCKASGESWPTGESLHYVLGDLSLTRFSSQQIWVPYWITALSTWCVLAWEVSFPLLVYFRRTRVWALLFGVAMHLGIFVAMELGAFPLYLLAAYAALLLELRLRQRGLSSFAPARGTSLALTSAACR